MKDYNDWEESTDVAGITVYSKNVNGYEREVWYDHRIHKWMFKKWTRKSGQFPEVGSRPSMQECFEECEEA